MIANILFFVGYTALIMWLLGFKCRDLMKTVDKQNANNKKMMAQCEEMSERLKLRINQNDTLLQVIDELNKKLQEVKK